MEMKAAWLRIWNTKNDMMVSSLGFLFAFPIPDQHPLIYGNRTEKAAAFVKGAEKRQPGKQKTLR